MASVAAFVLAEIFLFFSARIAALWTFRRGTWFGSISRPSLAWVRAELKLEISRRDDERRK